MATAGTARALEGGRAAAAPEARAQGLEPRQVPRDLSYPTITIGMRSRRFLYAFTAYGGRGNSKAVFARFKGV